MNILPLSWLPVVLLIPVVTDAVVVQAVEECWPGYTKLQEGSELSIAGQHVLVVPSPVGSKITGIDIRQLCTD